MLLLLLLLLLLKHNTRITYKCNKLLLSESFIGAQSYTQWVFEWWSAPLGLCLFNILLILVFYPNPGDHLRFLLQYNRMWFTIPIAYKPSSCCCCFCCCSRFFSLSRLLCSLLKCHQTRSKYKCQIYKIYPDIVH